MAGIRAGFFLGFLGGALLSSQAAKNAGDEGPLAGLRQRIREAFDAGKEAAQEKEDAMLRELEGEKRPNP
jgi:hypothetical protein